MSESESESVLFAFVGIPGAQQEGIVKTRQDKTRQNKNNQINQCSCKKRMMMAATNNKQQTTKRERCSFQEETNYEYERTSITSSSIIERLVCDVDGAS